MFGIASNSFILSIRVCFGGVFEMSLAGAWRVWIFRDRRSRLEFKTVWIEMLCRSTSEPFSYSNEKLQKLFRKHKPTLFLWCFTRVEVKRVVFTGFVSNQTFHARLYLGIWTTVLAWVMFYAFKSTLCIIFCEVLCLFPGLQSRSTGNNLLMDRNQKLYSIVGSIQLKANLYSVFMNFSLFALCWHLENLIVWNETWCYHEPFIRYSLLYCSIARVNFQNYIHFAQVCSLLQIRLLSLEFQNS